MSIFSGKHDLYDSVTEFINNRNTDIASSVRVYMVAQNANPEYYDMDKYNHDKKLHITNMNELLPYAAHMVRYFFVDKNGIYQLHIERESNIDREEREYFEKTFKIYREKYYKCMNKKVPFVPENEVITTCPEFRQIEIEIANRVLKNPDVINTSGLSLQIADTYRKRLLNKMVENGYAENDAYNLIYKEM